jgi:hypothetical protein
MLQVIIYTSCIISGLLWKRRAELELGRKHEAELLYVQKRVKDK